MEAHKVLEEWRPVPGYGNLYAASTLGRVKRVDTGKVVKAKAYGSTRYLVFGRTDGTAYVHQMVCLAFHGPAPGPTGRRRGCWQVDHENRNTLDNRPTNLRWLPNAENVRRGGRKCKLSNQQVQIIRDMVARELGLPGWGSRLARAWKVTPGLVNRIARGEVRNFDRHDA